MPLEYQIVYQAKNVYENELNSAFWQFLILPENNSSQELLNSEFENSIGAITEISINGFGYSVLRIRSKKPLKKISFTAKFKVLKQKINPYDFILNADPKDDYKTLDNLSFKTDNEPYFRETKLTRLPKEYHDVYIFDSAISVFENLKNLMNWVYIKIYFKVGVTDVDTQLKEIMENRQGVCQDFTHLFCAISRYNKVPCRYVSGYLHQGNGYFGDSQLHAWAEAYVPNVGWVGFDPTNDILVNQNHIKICHGKDYNDCSPLRGIVYGGGQNNTVHSVEVQSAQQQ